MSFSATATGAGRGALAIEASAFAAGVVLPVGMFVAGRSAPAILSAAALLAALGLYLDGAFGVFLERARRALARPGFVALRAFLLFFLVSIAWSAFPRAGAFAYGELIGSLAPALFLAGAWAVVPPKRLGLMLAAGLIVASLCTIADMRTGLWFRHAFRLRAEPYMLNRSVVSLLLLVMPMLLLARRDERWLAGLAIAAVGLAIWHSESGSARLGLLAALGVGMLAAAAPKLAAATLVGGTLLVLGVSPWIGPLMDRLLPAAAHEALYGMHSQDRVDIWRSFGAAVEQRPWLGSGFNASARMADDPVAALVAEPNRVLLGAGHPHNAYLQVWVEGGLVGALLLAVAILLVGRILYGLRGRAAVAALAMTAAATSIAAVSHGAWQGWWIAIVGFGGALLSQGMKERAHG